MTVEELIALAKEYGFTFIGGHPMAGRQFSGFRYAQENLFDGASMILVPKPGEDIALLEKAKKYKTKTPVNGGFKVIFRFYHRA